MPDDCPEVSDAQPVTAQTLRGHSAPLGTLLPMIVSLDTEFAAHQASEFSTLLASPVVVRQWLQERVMSLDPLHRPMWIVNFMSWIVSRAPKGLGPITSLALRELPTVARGRIESIKLTEQAAGNHPEFRRWITSADDYRDKGDFGNAEHDYWQALKLFPLHAGYRVQYAHSLKEQQKNQPALTSYWFAASLGAPRHDVEEHLLFVAQRAGITITSGNIDSLLAARERAQKTGDDWDHPPYEQDFRDFGLLLWGDGGRITSDFMVPHLTKCLTRRALFLVLLALEDTIRSNRLLFTLLNEKGSRSV